MPFVFNPKPLKAWLKKQRYGSQTQLAKAIGVSLSTMQYWLKGQRNPSYKKRLELARAIGVAPDALLMEVKEGKDND